METILVATDFSLPANNAVNYAASLAKYFSAKLVLVNACPIAISSDPAVTIDLSQLYEASLAELEKIRVRLCKESYDSGIVCDPEFGYPYTVIKTAAEKHHADLVVVGMTGEAGMLKEHLIGSTAVSVARDLTIPVMIVPQDVAYKRIRHIDFACDPGSAEETGLMLTVRYFAQVFDADLEIVTVDKSDHEMIREAPESFSLIEKKLKNVKHKQVYIKDDDASAALEYYFKFHDTDLVMVNPKKHNLFRRLFEGSVTSHLAFHSRAPLLVIH